MASRYQPGSNDGRSARPRSPPRYNDRRPSVPNGGFPGRNSDSSYRPADDNFGGSKEPPRGPRGAPYTPRGRAAFPRGRGGYDSFSRRDGDRSWSDRRDTYDERRVSPVGRARSRSPPPFRDSRDASEGSRAFDSPTDYRNRGGFGGRGRGFDSRGRARPSASTERDRPRPRSASHERHPDPDPRDVRFDRDRPRREDDRWEREKDSRRDLPPIRAESRPHDDHPRTASPSTASSASAPYAHPDGPNGRSAKPVGESIRRSSFPASSQPEARAREEARQSQSAANPPSSPPQAPSVPAYGSASAVGAAEASKVVKPVSSTQRNPEDPKTVTPTTPSAPIIPTAPRADLEDPLKDAPKAPKADLAKGPPTQPARRSMSNTMPPGRPFDVQDSARPSGPGQSPQIPVGPRALSGQTAPSSFGIMAGRPIPTGPKAFNMPTSSVWMRPAPRQPPTGPASASTVAKRDSTDDGKTVNNEDADKARSRNADGPTDEEMAMDDKLPKLPDQDDLMQLDSRTEEDEENKQPLFEIPLDSELPFPHSDEEDLIDDMSEEDLRAQEAKFERQREELEAKRPPPNQEDAELLVMLDELDAFAVALQDLKEGKYPPPVKEKPKQTPIDDPVAKAANNTPDARSPNGMPTPPTSNRLDIEDLSDEDESIQDALPYKRSTPPTPMSQIQALEEEKSNFAFSKDEMLATLSVRRKSDLDDAAALQRQFCSYFRSWREKVDDMEKEKQAAEVAQAAAEAADDQREVTPLPTPATEASRRRQFNNSAFDLDAALELSKQTHAAEQAKAKEAERLALTVPDMAKEAVVPDMLSTRLQQQRRYKDVNNKIEFYDAVKAFAFEPPKDDFTAEEQDLFEKAFVSNGHKQWGHIARLIPQRDYKDCIQHYYLTKKQYSYKHMFPKKGKGGRAAGRRKTNALLSDLSLRSDENGTNKVEMTETGRPKRAAAPTNFDRRQQQQQQVETTPARRGRGAAAAAKTVEAADAAEKPKRGRAAAKDKPSGKRAKGPVNPSAAAAAATATTATAVAPASVPSAAAIAIPNAVKKPAGLDGMPPDISVEDTKAAVNIAEAQLLASLKAPTQFQVPPPQAGHTEDWLNPPSALAPLSRAQVELATGGKKIQLAPPEPVVAMQSERTAPKVIQPLPEQEPIKSADGIPQMPKKGRGTNGSSSYWSTKEQEQVRQFMPVFGSSWEDYAARMSLKTSIMVKNQVQRLIKSEEVPFIQQMLDEADEANKKDPGRILALIAAGSLEPPAAPSQDQSPQRVPPPAKKPVATVKTGGDEKLPARGRSDSHIAVAPKPADPALDSASPARPRVKSNASTKTSTFQIQPQQSQPAPAVVAAAAAAAAAAATSSAASTAPIRTSYYDQQPQSKPIEKAHAPQVSDPTPAAAAQQQQQPQQQPHQPHQQQPHQPHQQQPHQPHQQPQQPPQPKQQPQLQPQPQQPQPQPTAGHSREPSGKWSIPESYAPRDASVSIKAMNSQREREREDQHLSNGGGFGPDSSAARARDWTSAIAPIRQEPDLSRMGQQQRGQPHNQPVSVEQQQRGMRQPFDGPPTSMHQDSYRRDVMRMPETPYGAIGVPTAPVTRPGSVPVSSLTEPRPPPPSHASQPMYQSQSSAPAPVPAAAPAPPKRSGFGIHDLLNDAPSPKRITTNTREPAPVPTPPPSHAVAPPPAYQPNHQTHQGHQAHQAHQGHQGHQTHQVHQGHQMHQVHQTHQSHQGHQNHQSHQSQYSSRPHIAHTSHPGMPEPSPYAPRRDDPRDRHQPSHTLYDRGHVPPPPQMQPQHAQSHYSAPQHEHARQWSGSHQHQHPLPGYGAPAAEPSRVQYPSYVPSPQPTQPAYAPPPPHQHQHQHQHQGMYAPGPPPGPPQPSSNYDYTRTPSMANRPPPEHTLGAPSAYRANPPAPPIGQGPSSLITGSRPASAFGHHGPPPTHGAHASPLPPHAHAHQHGHDRTYTPGPYQGGYPPPGGR